MVKTKEQKMREKHESLRELYSAYMAMYILLDDGSIEDDEEEYRYEDATADPLTSMYG